ncbi:glycoside hydrolase [Podospora appendiculata]|uniref:alpha-1,2-Mannosidase n=1 Tax=Podospora appendiculata TaxID=314037 RepID=A0AAE1C9G3_9PEZI|nr:glycoside hydrolase [Podospora appendiculata]
MLVIIAVFLAAVLLFRTKSLEPYYLVTNTDLLAPGTTSNPKPTIRFYASSFQFNSTSVPQRYPVSPIHQLPSGPLKHSRLHRVQHSFPHYQHDPATKARQDAVRAAFVRSWDSYKEHAWLWDELAPVSGQGKNTFGGWAATLVDSLDTLWIMDLREDFYLAAAAAAQLDWANTTETAVNLFETTIRHLGGLLGAYDLSGEKALLEKATELGDMLYMAFDTPNRLPGFWLDFEKAKQGVQVAGSNDPAAAPCSLSLEFTRLAQLTGDSKYFDAVSRVTDFLEQAQGASKLPGMWPKLINFRDERVDAEIGFTLGALSDSLYEYLPKMALLLDGQAPRYENMYRTAAGVIKTHILFRPMLPDTDSHNDILFAGDAYVHADRIDHVSEGQHLSCFAGGMFGLGGKLFDIPDHVAIGERLARGCGWAYDAFPAGMMPEIFNMMACDSLDGPCPWDEHRWQKHGDQQLKKGVVNARDPRYILRPEAIESLFLLYRMTGKEDLRDVAWRMFQDIMANTQTPFANSAIANVTVHGETEKLDSMESFWMSETLKYFYLMFSPPDLISLDEFVFNTEAHPFRQAAP